MSRVLPAGKDFLVSSFRADEDVLAYVFPGEVLISPFVRYVDKSYIKCQSVHLLKFGKIARPLHLSSALISFLILKKKIF